MPLSSTETSWSKEGPILWCTLYKCKYVIPLSSSSVSRSRPGIGGSFASSGPNGTVLQVIPHPVCGGEGVAAALLCAKRPYSGAKGLKGWLQLGSCSQASSGVRNRKGTDPSQLFPSLACFSGNSLGVDPFFSLVQLETPPGGTNDARPSCGRAFGGLGQSVQSW